MEKNGIEKLTVKLISGLSSSKSLDFLLDLILHDSGANRAALASFDPGACTITLLAAAGDLSRVGPVGISSVIADNRFLGIVGKRQATIVNEFVQLESGNPDWRLVHMTVFNEMRSNAVVPLFSEDLPLGVLFLSSKTENFFTADVATRFGSVADIMAIAIERARSRQALLETRQENISLKQVFAQDFGHSEIVGTSPSLLDALAAANKVAPSDVHVLIRGEAGTGKEMFSRAIHRLSARRNCPLIRVNCTSKTESIFEREMFGNERGAFIGASELRLGKLELANGGTVFLNDVADIPLDLQAKVLRAMQEGEVERVGGTKPIKVSIRVIAATNRILEDLVKKGTFLNDLYYRLTVFPITLSPLRERTEDIEDLTKHFVKVFSAKIGKRISGVSMKVLEMFTNYSWPGNISELENIVERAVIICDGDTIEERHIKFLPALNRSAAPEIQTLEDFYAWQEKEERRLILSALKKSGGRIGGKGGAAEILGVKAGTLSSRLSRLGMRAEDGVKE